MTYKPVGVMRFQELTSGALRVWELPKDTVEVGTKRLHATYVVGADVSMGLDGNTGSKHGDYSSAHISNHTTGLVVAHWHGLIEPDKYGELLYELGWFYNCALLGVEANNHGLTTLTQLRNDGYPKLYRRHTQGKDFNSQTHNLGWYTSKASKPMMLDQLARALVSGELELHCPETIKELMTFVRDTEDGSLHGSPHDDRVMSLAIANQMRNFAHAPEYQVNERAPEFSLEWWANQIEDRSERKSEWVLGSGSIRGNV